MSRQILFLNGRRFEWHATKQMSNINHLFIYLLSPELLFEIELGVEG